MAALIVMVCWCHMVLNVREIDILIIIFFFRERLSLAYAFFAWNMFGFLAYMVYKGRMTKVDDGNEESQGKAEGRMTFFNILFFSYCKK